MADGEPPLHRVVHQASCIKWRPTRFVDGVPVLPLVRPLQGDTEKDSAASLFSRVVPVVSTEGALQKTTVVMVVVCVPWIKNRSMFTSAPGLGFLRRR
ncbi:hypothetical protein MTO96_024905 [Rhipicephalus appendiculatus]